MRRGAKLLIWAVSLITVTAMTVPAQEPEIVIGTIGFPERVWGEQTIKFDVTNTVDWVKYLVLETEVSFEDSYVTPHRVRRTNFTAVPGTSEARAVMEIPPNYGQLTFWVRVYDVVDTLDDISLGTQVFEQPFKVRFHTPEAVLPYFEERLTMPPLVGEHGIFDNEFSRLLLVFAQEGKSVNEIAGICNTTEDYVRARARELISTGYLRRVNDTADVREFEPNIPVITRGYAVDGRALVDSVSVKLADQVTKNLSFRQALIDSLTRDAGFSGDSGAFFEGGTLLYRPFPLVGGLFFWGYLGQKFVTGNEPLEIFKDTDPCRPHLGPLSYLVQGGDYYNGTHYFNAEAAPDAYRAHWSDSIPEIICAPGTTDPRMARLDKANWGYGPGWKGEVHLYDTTFINPMIRHLDVGVEDLMKEAIAGLHELNREYLGTPNVGLGARYWFWNLLATRTLTRLVDEGVLTRTNNGQFRFMEKKK